MEEYKRLYELYVTKSDLELKDIVKSENQYSQTAIKVASDILTYGKIGCDEIIRKSNLYTTNLENRAQNKNTLYICVIAVAVLCSVIACATIISSVCNIKYIKKLNTSPNNKILGNIYEGAGDYFGIIFYFYDKNTYAFSTSSGEKISYGTYDIDGNAIVLNFSSDTYSAVVLDKENTIMIGDSQLTKEDDEKQIEKYKDIFTDLNEK